MRECESGALEREAKAKSKGFTFWSSFIWWRHKQNLPLEVLAGGDMSLREKYKPDNFDHTIDEGKAAYTTSSVHTSRGAFVRISSSSSPPPQRSPTRERRKRKNNFSLCHRDFSLCDGFGEWNCKMVVFDSISLEEIAFHPPEFEAGLAWSELASKLNVLFIRWHRFSWKLQWRRSFFFFFIYRHRNHDRWSLFCCRWIKLFPISREILLASRTWSDGFNWHSPFSKKYLSSDCCWLFMNMNHPVNHADWTHLFAVIQQIHFVA